MSLSRSVRGRGSVLLRPPRGDGSEPAGREEGGPQGGNPPPRSVSPRHAWPRCFWSMSRLIRLSSQGCGRGVRQAGDAGPGPRLAGGCSRCGSGLQGGSRRPGSSCASRTAGAPRPPCPGSSVRLSQSLLHLPWGSLVFSSCRTSALQIPVPSMHLF